MSCADGGCRLELLYVARYPRKGVEAPHSRCTVCGTGWSWTRPLRDEAEEPELD